MLLSMSPLSSGKPKARNRALEKLFLFSFRLYGKICQPLLADLIASSNVPQSGKSAVIVVVQLECFDAFL